MKFIRARRGTHLASLAVDSSPHLEGTRGGAYWKSVNPTGGGGIGGTGGGFPGGGGGCTALVVYTPHPEDDEGTIACIGPCRFP